MPAKSLRITIHDVAAEAGVSIKTVSRVIRNEPKASEETRRIVREAIERLGYVPDMSARALSSTVTPVIGLVSAGLSDPSLARTGYEYRMSLLIGAHVACAEAGFGLSLVRLTARDKPPRYDDLLGRVRRREVGGLLITAPTCDRPGLMASLQAAAVPVALVSAFEGLHDGPSVVGADRTAMAELTRLVLSHGHRRVAFIRGHAGWRDTEERHAGFMQAMQEAGLQPDPAWVLQGEYSFEAGRACAQQLLGSSRKRPTAVICSSDDIAAGVIAIAHEMGLELPRDLSVAGYDDTALARKLWPPLTTVHQPVEQMAEQAVRLLLQRMRPDRHAVAEPTMRLELPAQVVVRLSLARPRS